MSTTYNAALVAAVTLVTSLSYGAPKGLGHKALGTAIAISSEGEPDSNEMRALPPVAADQITMEVADDGTHFALLRIRGGHGRAARLLIRNMDLAENQKLYVYGVNGGDVVKGIAGPYTESGPGQAGEFWTSAVEGSDIIVEFQSTGTVPGDFPFEVAGIVFTSKADDASENRRGTGEVRTSLYQGVALTHTVEDGIAIFEGDIELGPADELRPAEGSAKSSRRQGVGITSASYRWPNGVMPYEIDAASYSTLVTRVTAAVNHWNTLLAGHVKLIPRTNETDYVRFVRPATNVCSSTVGRRPGGQTISAGDGCTWPILVHEIGHAFGLWHEQSREDRNSYVSVQLQNVKSGYEHNFSQQTYSGDDWQVYDYGSIMHYGSKDFSSNGLPTIVTVPAGIAIGQRSSLSAGDILAIRSMYPATGAPSGTTAVTIASIPAGLTVTVDGAAVRTPATFQWAPGSVHALSAPASVNTSTTTNTFVRWTDRGALSHTVVTPLAPAVFRADYRTEHLLLQSAGPGGSTTAAPASTSGWYVPLTSVALNAVQEPGYCFVSWTGLAAGVPASTSLSMTKGYTVQANFQAGSVTPATSAITVPLEGGTIDISVAATSGCLWTAASNAWWAVVKAGVKGTGPGAVSVAVSARAATAAARTATITIGGAKVTITQ